jgi:hypothetical protein
MQQMSVAQVQRQAEIERLLAPRRAHGRPPTAEWLNRARLLREEAKKRGLKQRDFTPEQLVAMLPPLAGAASSFNVVLDTTAPGGAAHIINGGAAVSTSFDVTSRLTTTDTPKTGYQIKIWGDVDTAFNASIQATEGASVWFTPTWTGDNADQAVRLAAGEGLKTLNAKIRDDVWNETTTLVDTITVDTTVPVITILSGPDATKISKVSGKRVVTFTWEPDVAIDLYEVAVVANSGAARGTGTVIATTNGSTNVSGAAVAALADITTTIDGRDLEVASAGDGTKVVKVFGREAATGLWSA